MSPCNQMLIMVFLLALLFIAIESYFLWKIYKFGKTSLGELGSILDNPTFCGVPGCEAYTCGDYYNDDLPMPLFPAQANPQFNPASALYMIDLIERVVIQSEEESIHPEQKAYIPPPPGLTIQAEYRDVLGELLGVLYLSEQDPVGQTIAFVVWKGTTTRYQYGIDGDLTQFRAVILHHASQKVPESINDPLHLTQTQKLHGDCKILQRPPLVHSGFEEVYLQVREPLMKDIRSIQPNSIFITGHSLGGAISNLFAIDLLYHPIVKDDPSQTPLSITTFGCPRVGTPEFCALFDRFTSVREFWSVMNDSDLIPQLPLAVMPNAKNLRRPTLYDHAGNQVHFNLNLAGLTQNHVLNAYREGIQYNLVDK